MTKVQAFKFVGGVKTSPELYLWLAKTHLRLAQSADNDQERLWHCKWADAFLTLSGR